jgi:hypothetical protein
MHVLTVQMGEGTAWAACLLQVEVEDGQDGEEYGPLLWPRHRQAVEHVERLQQAEHFVYLGGCNKQIMRLLIMEHVERLKQAEHDCAP